MSNTIILPADKLMMARDVSSLNFGRTGSQSQVVIFSKRDGALYAAGYNLGIRVGLPELSELPNDMTFEMPKGTLNHSVKLFYDDEKLEARDKQGYVKNTYICHKWKDERHAAPIRYGNDLFEPVDDWRGTGNIASMSSYALYHIGKLAGKHQRIEFSRNGEDMILARVQKTTRANKLHDVVFVFSAENEKRG